jgi:hypothetical protein
VEGWSVQPIYLYEGTTFFQRWATGLPHLNFRAGHDECGRGNPASPKSGVTSSPRMPSEPQPARAST